MVRDMSYSHSVNKALILPSSDMYSDRYAEQDMGLLQGPYHEHHVGRAPTAPVQVHRGQPHVGQTARHRIHIGGGRPGVPWPVFDVRLTVYYRDRTGRPPAPSGIRKSPFPGLLWSSLIGMGF